MGPSQTAKAKRQPGADFLGQGRRKASPDAGLGYATRTLPRTAKTEALGSETPRVTTPFPSGRAALMRSLLGDVLAGRATRLNVTAGTRCKRAGESNVRRATGPPWRVAVPVLRK
jgi:hypothetical protein